MGLVASQEDAGHVGFPAHFFPDGGGLRGGQQVVGDGQLAAGEGSGGDGGGFLGSGQGAGEDQLGGHLRAACGGDYASDVALAFGDQFAVFVGLALILRFGFAVAEDVDFHNARNSLSLERNSLARAASARG